MTGGSLAGAERGCQGFAARAADSMMRRRRGALAGLAGSLACRLACLPARAHPRVFELLRAGGAGAIHRLPLALVSPVPLLQAALAGGHAALLGGAEPALQAGGQAGRGVGAGRQAVSGRGHQGPLHAGRVGAIGVRCHSCCCGTRVRRSTVPEAPSGRRCARSPVCGAPTAVCAPQSQPHAATHQALVAPGHLVAARTQERHDCTVSCLPLAPNSKGWPEIVEQRARQPDGALNIAKKMSRLTWLGWWGPGMQLTLSCTHQTR